MMLISNILKEVTLIVSKEIIIPKTYNLNNVDIFDYNKYNSFFTDNQVTVKYINVKHVAGNVCQKKACVCNVLRMFSV